MSYDSVKKDIGLFIGGLFIAIGIFLLKFLDTINPIVAIFFAIFVGALVVSLKNVVVLFRYREFRKIPFGRNMIIFPIIAVISLTVTCILAAVFS